MAGRIGWEVGRVRRAHPGVGLRCAQRRPERVPAIRRRFLPDADDWPPKVVHIFMVPGIDAGIGHGDVEDGEQLRRLGHREHPALHNPPRHLVVEPRRHAKVHRAIITPIDANPLLLGRARAAPQRAMVPHFLEILPIGRVGQKVRRAMAGVGIERQRRAAGKARHIPPARPQPGLAGLIGVGAMVTIGQAIGLAGSDRVIRAVRSARRQHRIGHRSAIGERRPAHRAEAVVEIAMIIRVERLQRCDGGTGDHVLAVTPGGRHDAMRGAGFLQPGGAGLVGAERHHVMDGDVHDRHGPRGADGAGLLGIVETTGEIAPRGFEQHGIPVEHGIHGLSPARVVRPIAGIAIALAAGLDGIDKNNVFTIG